MTFTEHYLIPMIKNIKDQRFFNSERGYQGQLVALLDRAIKDEKIFPDETIIEQEYQKTMKHHGIRQRPDIIIHIPIEAGLTDIRTENNFYVIALKLNAKVYSAIEDFGKLEDMFNQLDYPEGVFINIGAYPSLFLAEYGGQNQDRIHELSISLDNNEVRICHAKFENGEMVTKDDY